MNIQTVSWKDRVDLDGPMGLQPSYSSSMWLNYVLEYAVTIAFFSLCNRRHFGGSAPAEHRRLWRPTVVGKCLTFPLRPLQYWSSTLLPISVSWESLVWCCTCKGINRLILRIIQFGFNHHASELSIWGYVIYYNLENVELRCDSMHHVEFRVHAS